MTAIDTRTQPRRLYDYLASHPGASSREIQRALDITNATGRISDLRDMGERMGTFVVVKEKRSDGRDGYSVRPVGDLTLGLAS